MFDVSGRGTLPLQDLSAMNINSIPVMDGVTLNARDMAPNNMERLVTEGHNQIRDNLNNLDNTVVVEPSRIHPTQVFNNIDDDYLLVSAHIDLSTQVRIARGEYVELEKLLPKDRLSSVDNRMELVNKGGRSYFVLVTEKDRMQITSFG